MTAITGRGKQGLYSNDPVCFAILFMGALCQNNDVADLEQRTPSLACTENRWQSGSCIWHGYG